MADKAPPKELDATGKHLYKTLRTYLRGQSTWQESDHYLLAEACRHEMLARFAKDDMTEDGRIVLTAEGYKGQPTQHPSYKTFQSESKAFLECLRELGLTPAQRSRLGIEVGSGGPSKFAR